MKKLLLIIFMIMPAMPFLLYGNQHFSWTSDTGNNATVAILLSTEITINGSALQPGDEIGVFTPDGLCVGGIVWEGENNQPLTVWGNDPMTPDVKDGIDVGETMYFRVWLHQENAEHTIVSVEYESGSGVYEVDGLYVVSSMTAVPEPDVPELLSPENNAYGIAPEVSFEWNSAGWADSYVIQVASGNSFNTIIAEEELEETETVIGFEFGATYYWRVRAVNIAGSSGWSGIRTFTTEEDLDLMEIQLQAGWNMISSNINPEVTDIAELFNEVDDPDLFIKNNAGTAYWPAVEIYDLTEWNFYEGYQVYVSQQHAMSWYGDKIDPASTPVYLSEGWNIIPYFLDTAVPVTDALQSVEDKIVVVKDIGGNVYWPEYEVNTLGAMQPGQGYQVYLSADAELTYPAATEKIVASDLAHRPVVNISTQQSHYNPEFTNTGSNAVLLVQCPEFHNDDEIGVWTSSGRLAGNGVVRNGRAVITIWGNNAATPDVIDGAVEDEELHLTIWSHTWDEERNLTVHSLKNLLESNKPDETLVFRENGLFVATVDQPSQVGQDAVPVDYSLAQNYPNPFNPSTQIQFSLQDGEHVRLTVYSLTGEKIAVLLDDQRPAGKYTINFDATGLSSGIYFYRLDAGTFNATRRMVVVR